MRVTRAHVETALASGVELTLPEPVAAHLVRVLRLQPGDVFTLFNGDGHDYAARIVAAGKREVRIRVEAVAAVDNESPLRITVLQGIARGERMDWIVQKATELGVAAIVPVSSERSEVRLDRERADKRTAHWRSVVVAACEQCGRARVPTVSAPTSLLAAVQALPAAAWRMLLDPEATRGLRDVADPGGREVVLAIGPEGGWSPRDIEILHAAGFDGVRLGPRVLRTETAGIAAIAALQATSGDFA